MFSNSCIVRGNILIAVFFSYTELAEGVDLGGKVWL